MAKFGELVDKALKFVDKNSPAILTGLTVAGVVATAISSYKAGPKINRIMREHREEMDRIEKIEDDDEFKKEKKKIVAETAKEIVPAVLPPIILGGLTIACAISANTVSSRRIAALSAAYEIASKSLSDYKDEIVKIVPKKADEIKEAVATHGTKGEKIPDEASIYSTGRGDVLCKDKYTKVYFRSSADEVDKAINKVSAKVRSESWISLCDLYWELGVPAEKIPPVANDIGWHDNDLVEGTLPITRGVCYDDTGTIPVIALDYEVDPWFKEGGRFR